MSSSLKFKIKKEGGIVRPPTRPTTTKLPGETPIRRPRNILEYLCSLEDAVLNNLYNDTYTCLTIFRSLPSLAKHFVMRLLTLDARIRKSLIDSWVRTDQTSHQLHQMALTRLFELKIFKQMVVEGEIIILVNNYFKESLRNALSTHISDSQEVATEVDPNAPTIQQLDDYSKKKWDQILHFMVGVKNMDSPSHNVQQRLLDMGLMEDTDEGISITSSGFAFLFKDINTQVWDLIIAYMDNLHQRDLDRDEVLRFLFRLSFLQLGQGYPVDSLTPTQRTLLQDLGEFGLVYQRRSGAKIYYCTRLASNLSSSVAQTSKQDEGYIVIETTFRVYGYTTSPFQVALLSLFAKLDYKLPNMVVGTITKHSVRNALKHNISADEIVNYLDQYAHPQMRKAASSVPSNLADQIRLWEAERNRLNFVESVQIEDFADLQEMTEVVEIAQKHDMLLYCNEANKEIIVLPQCIDIIKQYKANKQQQQQGWPSQPPPLMR